MHKVRRFIIIALFLVSAGLLVAGFWMQSEPTYVVLGHKLIGFSVALGFFVVMPLFIYHRWKGKSVKDYMLTEENILKMKAYNDSKK